MADVALIVVSVIVPFLLLACSLYILLNYQHPDDHNQSWFPKIVVVRRRKYTKFEIAPC